MTLQRYMHHDCIIIIFFVASSAQLSQSKTFAEKKMYFQAPNDKFVLMISIYI